VTPLHKDGSLDLASLGQLIHFNIQQGINYLVSLGTTGETAVLSKEEKKEVWKHTVQVVGGRVPLLIGLGGNDTAALCRELEHLDLDGFDAVLSVSPYYNRPSQEGLYQHYCLLEKASPLPLMIYNVPARTGMNISAATTLRLAEASPKFIGIKEASGNFAQIMEIIRLRRKDFLVVSGDDNLTLPLMAAGCDGLISVAANCFPGPVSAMVKNALEGRYREARDLHYRLLHAMDLLFSEGSPAGVKAALSIKNICGSTVRLPNVEASAGLLSALEAEMAAKEL